MLKYGVFSFLGILCFCTGCRSGQDVQPEKVITVKTEVVKQYQNELVITYPGKVKAASDVNLSFRVAGPLAHIPVEVGAFVRKGQVIAEMDRRDYEIQLSATEAEYKRIKGEAGRIIELYKRGSVPVNDYDKAVYGLQQITAKYEAHKNALNDTRLVAPFEGYIQKKYFDEHETVGAGLPVIAMINSSYFEVEVDIPSSDFIRQDHFKNFCCTFDIFPDRVFPLELIEIVRKANLNQLYRVRLRLKHEKGINIAAGMSVNVTIEYTPDATSLTVVPVSAVFESEGKSAVWVYDEATGKVKMRSVKLDKVLKTGEAVVTEGLQEGESVISAGVHSLKEGMNVKLIEPVSDTNIGGLL